MPFSAVNVCGKTIRARAVQNGGSCRRSHKDRHVPLFSPPRRGRLAELEKARRRTSFDRAREKGNARGRKISRSSEGASRPDRDQPIAARRANGRDRRGSSQGKTAPGRITRTRVWLERIENRL